MPELPHSMTPIPTQHGPTRMLGDTLVFKFPSNLPRELNGTPFYGIDIANGCLHPENAFKDFGRIKTIRLYHNGHPLYMIHLADTRRWQHVTFSDVYLSIGDTLAIEVLDTYSGEKKRTTADYRDRPARCALDDIAPLAKIF